eukprot:786742-Amphidinium_carterae.1
MERCLATQPQLGKRTKRTDEGQGKRSGARPFFLKRQSRSKDLDYSTLAWSDFGSHASSQP